MNVRCVRARTTVYLYTCAHAALEHACMCAQSFWNAGVCYAFDGQSLVASLKLAASVLFWLHQSSVPLSRPCAHDSSFKLTRL